MKIRYATISKEGRRSNNEDFFVVMDQQERGRFWGIVCDGMGGHACGEVASETVAHAVSAYWEQHAEERDSEDKVVEACQEATRAIEQKAREVGLAEMGTTLVMASIEGDIVTIARVGDSRCYLQRPGQGVVYQTQDHVRLSFGTRSWRAVSSAVIRRRRLPTWCSFLFVRATGFCFAPMGSTRVWSPRTWRQG